MSSKSGVNAQTWPSAMMSETCERVCGGYADESEAPVRQTPLFRKEAFDSRADLRLGRPIALMPLGWKLVAGFVVALVASAVIGLAMGSYSRKERGVGILRPVSGDARILPQQPGTVVRLAVREEQHVSAGDILAVVSTDPAGTTGQSADAQVLASLAADEQSLRRRLAGASSSLVLDESASRSRVAALVVQQKTAAAAVGSLGERLKLAEEQLNLARPVAEKGYMSGDELRRRQDAVIQGRQALSDAEGQAASLAAQVAEAAATAARAPYVALHDRGDIEDRLQQVIQQRAQLEMRRGYAIRAPLTGKVTTLQVHQGSSVAQQEPLMSIAPEGAELVAEVYLPSRAIGFLAPGQSVRILYDSFPVERFGTFHGTVQSISDTVLKPNELGAAVPVKEPVYRVVVRLDRQTIQAFDKNVSLQAGMALTAEVIIEKRSFAEWLFEPILAIGRRA